MSNKKQFFKPIQLVLLASSCSFVLGAGMMDALQTSNHTLKSALESLKTAVASVSFSEEPVINALSNKSDGIVNFKDDPFNVHFEVTHIEPEKKAEVTGDIVDKVLSDYQSRIAPEFEIPDLIYNQTKFWFRIYTEFDSNKKVIHDSLHPHIIYDIVDVADIMALPANASWLNVVKAQKAVAKRTAEIRAKLKKMSKKKEEDMDAEELGWLAQFKEIKGNQKRIILMAAQSLRVQTGQKDFFESGLAVSGRYIQGMETIFKAKKLPIELTRLPFVESSFAIGATSKVGAAGIWQFMPGIGRQFMTVNDQFDERRNPWKATEAAAKLLKENYQILHKNWGLALTAYNHGPAGVRLAMKKTGTKDIAKIVRTYRSRNFDFASANFFTCFLAAVHAQMYRDVLWADHVADTNLAYESTQLKKGLKPTQLMQTFGFTAEQILLYNPELDRSFKHNSIIPKGYKIFTPAQIKTAEQNQIVSRKEGSTSLSAQ
ncbi:MAG: lytic transglycosylase domain-containing protein [Bdellovibrio sp.]|nr:lytic transglycosylase domain-containing protein [Bdellovibrio sp.]